MSKLSISINKPCSEKWDSFEKTNNGGFCSSCQKDVIDFTKYSDKEIVNYFKKHSFNKACGRFKSNQLKTYALPKRKRDFSIAAVLTAGLLTIVSPSESKAMPNEYEAVDFIDKTKGKSESVEGKISSKEKHLVEIKGKVIISDDDSSLPGVNVIIKGKNIGTTTDAGGNFLLNYDAGDDEMIIIEFSFIGLVTQEKEVVLSQTAKDIGTVVLSTDITGGICVDRWYTPGRWWRGVQSIFRRHY